MLSERITRKRLIGAAVVVLVPIVVAVLTIRPHPFREQQVVWATFDEAKGLARVDRDVRVAGVNVGEIGRVVRVGDDAKLELKLTPEAGTVYADATVSLRPHTAFEGDAFVDLDPGTPSAGKLGDRVIPKSRTTVYVALDESLRGLDAPRREAVQDITEENAKLATPGAEKALGETLSEAPETLKAAVPAARAAQGPTGDELRSTVRNLSLGAPALGSRADEIAASLTHAERTLAAVDTDNGQTLDALLVALPGAIDELRANSSTLVDITRRLNRLTAVAGPVLDEATPLLEDVGPLLRRSVPVLQAAPPLTRDLQLVLQDLAASTPAVRALLAPISTSVDTLNSRALPAVTAKGRLGTPAFDQFLSAGAGLTGAFANYRAEGQDPTYGKGHFGQISGDLVNGLLGMTNTLPSAARKAKACGQTLYDATGKPAQGCGG